MTATLVGYARYSTDRRDLTAQREALVDLGVEADRIYTDKGLSGKNRARPGLDQAMAAVREGDTLVVPKLDRLARSVPDARHMADQLEAKGVKLVLGGNIYDPADPMSLGFSSRLRTPPLPVTHARLATSLHTGQDSLWESLIECDLRSQPEFLVLPKTIQAIHWSTMARLCLTCMVTCGPRQRRGWIFRRPPRSTTLPKLRRWPVRDPNTNERTR